MKKTALVILAAGIGSRFGGGIKQLTPVGPNGEIIMDYSIHDAVEAGFDKVVFIIRKDLDEDFRQIIGDRISRKVEVAYAYQELDDLPEGYSLPEGRGKPWGTGQAILAARDVIKEPFAVVNADDYYGKEGFRALHDALVSDQAEDGKENIYMAGFVLRNTLSDNGGVTRGICSLDSEGLLRGIDETKNIIKTAEGAAAETENGLVKLDPDSLVSMNMWGFSPSFMERLKTGFPEFLSRIPEGDIKAEYLLPIIVDELLKAGEARVQVLKTNDRWFGVTYKEDRKTVEEAFLKLANEGVYPSLLAED
ncbi:MAG: NTP transferase domain-containing protein [Lachnospiraceae bacterium]|nr:NTP transferase domain-containing protein [Lachnospiraceae bacterium]